MWDWKVIGQLPRVGVLTVFYSETTVPGRSILE